MGGQTASANQSFSKVWTTYLARYACRSPPDHRIGWVSTIRRLSIGEHPLKAWSPLSMVFSIGQFSRAKGEDLQ